MPEHLIVNCETGEAESMSLTPEEEAQRAADEQAYLAAQQAAEEAAQQPTAVELIVQAVVTAPDCPPGVRAAILAAQQAQAGQA